MRQTKNTPAGEEPGRKIATGGFWRRSFSSRLAALRIVCGAALLAGIALSPKLWFPVRRFFPRAPLLVVLPAGSVHIIEYMLSGLMVAALITLLAGWRTALCLKLVILPLALLILLDQTRLQPWVYQYLLLFIVMALPERQSAEERSTGMTLSAMQLIVATLYFWGGIQKLNYSFSHEVLPQLLAPLQGYLQLNETGLLVLGIGIALVELFTGCGLLLRPTRKLCVRLAIAMHGLILGLLIAAGRNSVVWPWNAALMLITPLLFGGSNGSLRQMIVNWRVSERASRIVPVPALICAVLPVLSFWGWWDLYLSGALYSGNTAVAVIRVDGGIEARLPETAKPQVFATKSGERMLPLFEWAMAELNVPPYPEPRVFRQITREVCRLADDQSQAGLIMRGRPAILDGSYKVIRISCAELGD